MQEAVEQAPIDHSTTPDACAYCDVEKGIEAPSCTPTLLRERCRVYIGVESDWEAQSPAERPCQVSMGPAGFRC
jgi:hypothetical protein